MPHIISNNSLVFGITPLPWFFVCVFFLIDLSSSSGPVTSTLTLQGWKPVTDIYTRIYYWKHREGCWRQLRLKKVEPHKSDNYIANTITGSLC